MLRGGPRNSHPSRGHHESRRRKRVGEAGEPATPMFAPVGRIL